MTYPIDTEAYIDAMRQEFGPNEAVVELHREIIPFVNGYYQDGLDGADGYPMDPEAEFKAFADYIGRPIGSVRENKVLWHMIAWANRAYEQGREDAEDIFITAKRS